jgi:hypothetical protein
LEEELMKICRNTMARAYPRLRFIVSVVALAILLLASGCAVSYVPAPAGSIRDVGYSDEQISPRRYRVSYVSTRGVGRSQTKALAMLRAAHLARQNGADSLRVLGDSLQSFGGGFKGIGRRYRSVVYVQLISRGDVGGWPPSVNVDSILSRAKRDGIELR